MIEPENARDAAGSVVDGETEEFEGFVIAEGYGSYGFGACDGDGVAGEGVVWGDWWG